MTTAHPIDRALAWLWLGVLASVPVFGVLASRSPAALVVAIGLFAIALLVRGGLPQRWDWPLTGTLTAFIAISIGAAVLAETGTQAALERTAKTAGLFVAGMFAVGAALRGGPLFASPRAKYLITGLFLASVALLALEVIADAPLYRLNRGLDASARIRAWTFDRSALIVCIFIWPAVACVPSRWMVPVALTLSVLILGTLPFTESQTGPLVVVVSLVAFFSAYALPRLSAMVIAGVVAAYAAVAPWLFIAIHSRAASRFGEWTEASAGARLDIWRVTANMVLERPFTGHGPNALRRVENIFSQDDVFMLEAGKTSALHPHNFALQVWLDLGITGVVVLIALIFLAFWRVSRCGRPLAAAGTAMLVAIFVAGSLSPGLWQGWWLGTVALAVCQFVVATRSREPFAIDQIGTRSER